MVKELNDITFKTETEAKDMPVLVDFWATWCAPCRMQAPIIEELDSEMSDKVKFCKLNVDENLDSANAYKINGIPTLLIFKGGEIVEKVVGLTAKAELKELLLKHI